MAPSMIKVHRFQASLFPVNAYLVEAPSSVIAIDATLGVSDGRALGASGPGLAPHRSIESQRLCAPTNGDGRRRLST
jgi:hypothetical protein